MALTAKQERLRFPPYERCSILKDVNTTYSGSSAKIVIRTS